MSARVQSEEVCLRVQYQPSKCFLHHDHHGMSSIRLHWKNVLFERRKMKDKFTFTSPSLPTSIDTEILSDPDTFSNSSNCDRNLRGSDRIM